MATQRQVYLLVGTKKGAFVLNAAPRRKTWKVAGPVLKGAEVNDIVVDTRDKPTLYACVNSYWWGPNVHISTNMGKSWKQSEGGVRFSSNAGKTLTRVWTVKPGRVQEPGVLYAGVDPAALFRSEDSGNTWSEIRPLSEHPTKQQWMPGAGGMMVHSILLHPSVPEKMYVGISAAGVFATENNGASWEARNKNVLVDFKPDKYPEAGQCVHHLDAHPSRPEMLYQQNHCGVYRSDNEGKSWVDISKGLPSRFGFPLEIHPHDPNTIFVIPEEGPQFRASATGKFEVYRSSNRGVSWKKMTKGLPGKPSFLHVHRQATTHDGLDPFGLYVGTTGGQIFFSEDDGTSWRVLAEFLPPICSLHCAYV